MIFEKVQPKCDAALAIRVDGVEIQLPFIPVMVGGVPAKLILLHGLTFRKKGCLNASGWTIPTRKSKKNGGSCHPDKIPPNKINSAAKVAKKFNTNKINFKIMLQLTKKAANTWRKSAQNECTTFKSILVNYFNAQLSEDVEIALQAANIDVCLSEGVDCWTKSQIDKKGIFSLCAKFAPSAICGEDKQFICISSKNEERTAFSVPQIIENLPNVQEEKKNGLYYYFVNTTRKKRVTITTKDENGKVYTHKITTDENENIKMYVYIADRFTFAQVAEILHAAINNKLHTIEEEQKRAQAEAQSDALANGASNTSITDAGSAQADAAEAKTRTKQRQKTNTRTKASEQITK